MSSLNTIKALYHGIPANIYTYGSRCYGTHGEKSDEDFIVVAEYHPEIELPGVEVHQYHPVQYKEALLSHEIWALECYFLTESLKREDFIKEPFELDLAKLRVECSSKASNSWVKAKKKIEKEGEIYIGEKSLFHSLRILDFGIQLAEKGSIENFDSQNENFYKIVNQGKAWDSLKAEFQPLYNNLASRLRILCPLK